MAKGSAGMGGAVAWAWEFCALLPFAYAAKIWNAHYEFMENLSLIIPRA
jgi:hypothetical protein